MTIYSLDVLLSQFWTSPWCMERLKAGGEGDNRVQDGWMASPTQRTWVWASSRRWWRRGNPGVLQSTESQSRTRMSNWTTTTVPCLVLTVASWDACMFFRRQVRWSGIPNSLKIFQFVLWPIQRLQCSQWSISRCFSGILLLSLWPNVQWQFDLWFLCLF